VDRLDQVFLIHETNWQQQPLPDLPDKLPVFPPIKSLLIAHLNIISDTKAMKLVEFSQDETGHLLEVHDRKPVENPSKQTKMGLLDAFVRGFWFMRGGRDPR
jgi:hypothetical protein